MHVYSVWQGHVHAQVAALQYRLILICIYAKCTLLFPSHPPIHFLLEMSMSWQYDQFCTQIHTHTHTNTLKVTEKGLIRTLTQELIADPALFPADLLSLYCAKSVLLLGNKDFPC